MLREVSNRYKAIGVPVSGDQDMGCKQITIDQLTLLRRVGRSRDDVAMKWEILWDWVNRPW